jgi:arsenite methyltransferase
MRMNVLFLAAFFTFIAGSALAQDQHQHRRPDDIKQYLEHLDSAERDQYQKPGWCMPSMWNRRCCPT